MLDRNLYKSSSAFEPGEIICVCYFKTREQIIAAIKDQNLSTVASIGQGIKAGTNCGRCQNKIQTLIDETLGAAQE